MKCLSTGLYFRFCIFNKRKFNHLHYSIIIIFSQNQSLKIRENRYFCGYLYENSLKSLDKKHTHESRTNCYCYSDNCTDEQYTIMLRCSALMHHGVCISYSISPSQCTANLTRRIKGST